MNAKTIVDRLLEDDLPSSDSEEMDQYTNLLSNFIDDQVGLEVMGVRALALGDLEVFKREPWPNTKEHDWSTQECKDMADEFVQVLQTQGLRSYHVHGFGPNGFRLSRDEVCK